MGRGIARMGAETREGKGGAYRVLVYENDVINIFKEKGSRLLIGFIWPSIGSNEHGNEVLGSIKCWGNLNLMSKYYIFKKK
jgi:hypothetical protein